jgi:long-chain acyl-CoA synthetase
MNTAVYIWEKSYPAALSWGAPLPAALPVESLLRRAAEKWPKAVALDFYDRHITYEELYALAKRAAKGFQAHNVGPGARVGLHLPNTPHYVVCFFGVLMAGGIVVNLSPVIGARELGQQIADTQPEVVMTFREPSIRAKIAAVKPAAAVIVCDAADFLAPGAPGPLGKSAQQGALADNEIGFADFIANDGTYCEHPHGSLEDETAAIQYTGGTTGEMKGAMLTHANFAAVVAMQRRWNGDGCADRDGEEQPRALVVLPFYHVFGLSCILLTSVSYGARMVLHLRFDPSRTLEDISRKKITIFAGVPAMYAALADHSRIGEFDLSSLRSCTSGGAPLSAALSQRFKQLTGVAIAEGYGLTELAPLGTQHPRDSRSGPGNVGLPLPNTLVEIVDVETGMHLLPAGMAGEVCFTGPQVMKGYWRRPEATAEAFRGNRFHTGDIGFLDENGFLNLVDRKKDMIICGGYNVFPRNIEDALLEHPSVAEVIVIGVSEPNLGQAAKAFIVQKEGSARLTYRDVCKFLNGKLAAYEMPVDIEIRAGLPKTSIGKPSRKDLLAEMAAASR